MENVSVSNRRGSTATRSDSGSRPLERSRSSETTLSPEIRRRIVIGPTGQITYLDDPEISRVLSARGSISRKRASHIEPVDFRLRLYFRLLRWMFGERGRVAAWTRGWACEWRADLRISGGPVLPGFVDRSEAIAYEEEWLLENRL